jgi:hypothetical protein
MLSFARSTQASSQAKTRLWVEIRPLPRIEQDCTHSPLSSQRYLWLLFLFANEFSSKLRQFPVEVDICDVGSERKSAVDQPRNGEWGLG